MIGGGEWSVVSDNYLELTGSHSIKPFLVMQISFFLFIIIYQLDACQQHLIEFSTQLDIIAIFKNNLCWANPVLIRPELH